MNCGLRSGAADDKGEGEVEEKNVRKDGGGAHRRQAYTRF